MTPIFMLKLFLLLVWLLVKLAYDRMRNITRRLNGIHKRLEENKKVQPLNHGIAQIETILLKYKCDSLGQPPGIENFITYHSGFKDANCILNPNVTLYSVSAKQAVFIETDGSDVYSLKNGGAFLTASQFLYAKRIIILPLWAFVKLGQDVGPPKELLLMSFTARCGSTLLLQILEATKRCVVISEPAAIGAAQDVMGQIHDKAQVEDILKAVVNIYCKPVLETMKHMYVIKLDPQTIGNLKLLQRLYPEAKQIFMYRKGSLVVRSFSTLWHRIPFVFVIKYMAYLSNDVYNILLDGFGLSSALLPQRIYSYYHMSFVIWASAVRYYLQAQKDDTILIKAVRYEDIVADTDFAMKKVFEYLSLPYDRRIIESEFSKDSQRLTTLDRIQVKARKPIISVVTPDDIKMDFDEICHRFGIPNFEEDVIYPDTITHRHDIDDRENKHNNNYLA